MKNRYLEYKTTMSALAITVPFAATVWLFAVPQTVSSVTFVALALLVMGAALVALSTWRNGQATGAIGHLLHEAEAMAAIPPGRAPSDARGRS